LPDSVFSFSDAVETPGLYYSLPVSGFILRKVWLTPSSIRVVFLIQAFAKRIDPWKSGLALKHSLASSSLLYKHFKREFLPIRSWCPGISPLCHHRRRARSGLLIVRHALCRGAHFLCSHSLFPLPLFFFPLLLARSYSYVGPFISTIFFVTVEENVSHPPFASWSPKTILSPFFPLLSTKARACALPCFLQSLHQSFPLWSLFLFTFSLLGFSFGVRIPGLSPMLLNGSVPSCFPLPYLFSTFLLRRWSLLCPRIPYPPKVFFLAS